MISNLSCPQSHRNSHKEMYQDLVTFQNELMESQICRYEKNEGRIFIIIGFSKIEDKNREDLIDKIIEFISICNIMTGYGVYKFSSAILDKKNYSSGLKKNLLKFFKNVSKYSNLILKGIQLKDEIRERFKYVLEHRINTGQKMKQIFINTQKYWLNLQPTLFNDTYKCSGKNKTIDIVLIDNCLHELEIYFLLIDNFKKVEKTLYDKTNAIIIALRVNDTHKQIFSDLKPWM
ncbi:hypothetical protein COBT_002879, partial [Conglomerata obtusa]